MKSFLNIRDRPALGQAFDGFDNSPRRLRRKHQAGVYHYAIEENETGAADPHLAAQVRAGQFEPGPQEVRQRLARRDIARDILAIDDELNGHQFAHAASAIRPSRRPSRTRARWIRIAAGVCSSSSGSRSPANAACAATMAA